ncbi:DUF2199 domain-containing protein [Kitasatospora sp. NPDC051853]|uniref:DUF2199 domain-containing protein n=1 Tax=Kitasatospora sp. NPDC051853 TaxID=3364058 RepID=UPI0037B1CD4E
MDDSDLLDVVIVALVIGTPIGLVLGLLLRRRLYGTKSTQRTRYHAGLLREELFRLTDSVGEVVDIGPYVRAQPYGDTQVGRTGVFGMLKADGAIADLPAPDPAVPGSLLVRLTPEAWHEDLSYLAVRAPDAAAEKARAAVQGPDGRAEPVAAPLCGRCGEPLSTATPAFDHDLPDPVADLTEQERRQVVTFASEQTVLTRTLGGFVRALLPVRLTDGRTVSFGVWISVEADTYGRFADAVHGTGTGTGTGTGITGTGEPFDGRLATALAPWGDTLLAAPVTISSPRRGGGLRTPELLSSPAPALATVLRDTWPPAEVLSGERAWALPYDPDQPTPEHAH